MKVAARVIVNADDFGYSESINKAILSAFKNELISTTTLMCNTAGFEEACEIAHLENLTNRIGFHLNLSEGQPLTEPIRSQKKFYKDGTMYKSFKGHLLNKEERNSVSIELQAQFDRLRKLGINPTHCDSHHHLHHHWGIGSVVNYFALKNRIPAVRLRFNWGKMSIQRKLFSAIYNYRLKGAGMARTNYFCEIRSVTSELLRKQTTIEIMVHPVLNSDGKIINYSNGSDLHELVQNHLPSIHFINYKEIT